jgi:hypothetical protein
MDNLLAAHRIKKKKISFTPSPRYVGIVEAYAGVDYVKLCKTLSCFLFFSHHDKTFTIWIICDNLTTLFLLTLFNMTFYVMKDPTTFCYLDMYDKTRTSQKYFSHFNEPEPQMISFFDYPHIRYKIDNLV